MAISERVQVQITPAELKDVVRALVMEDHDYVCVQQLEAKPGDGEAYIEAPFVIILRAASKALSEKVKVGLGLSADFSFDDIARLCAGEDVIVEGARYPDPHNPGQGSGN